MRPHAVAVRSDLSDSVQEFRGSLRPSVCAKHTSKGELQAEKARKVRGSVRLLRGLFLTGLLVGVGPACVKAQEGEANLLANGSFEFWSRFGTERLKGMLEQGPSFDSDDPLLPVRWQWNARKPVILKQSTDAHRGKYAMAIAAPEGSAGANLRLGHLEVVPEAMYSFGVWVKGTGQVGVRVVGAAVEGDQELVKASGKVSGDWQRIGGTVVIPGHIRLVTLAVDVYGKSEVLLDDAYIAAPLDLAFDADEVLGKKPVADGDALLLADFEKDDPAIKLLGNAHLTEPGGGRFGRGLRLGKPDMATIPFKLGEMPKEGTLECWLSPDAMPMLVKETWETIHCFLQVWSGSQELAWLQADTSQCLRWCWRIDDAMYPKSNSVAGHSGISLQRTRKGQWTHVAIEWDPSAVRLYVDGVLAAVQTQPPLSWWAAPVNLTIASQHGHLCWNGVIDEIRVSRVKRYGPFTPKGAAQKPLPVPQVVAAKEAPVEEQAPKVDYAAERQKLLGEFPLTQPGAFETTPTSDGACIYEATSAQPLVTDNSFQLEADKIVKGLTTAWVGKYVLIGEPDNEGLYWRLGSLRPGKYRVGVVYESKKGEVEAPQLSFGRLGVYLNGRIVQLSTTSDPVQVAPGVWFAEAQAASSESLRPGDEIAVMPQRGDRFRIARLVLHSKEPARGAHRVATNFGGHWWCLYTSLRVNADTSFVAKPGKSCRDPNIWWRQEQALESPDDLMRGPDGRAVAHCRLANPLSVPVTVDYECIVKGYYRQVAGQDKARLTLPPHARLLREVAFEVAPDDPGYSIEARLQAVNPPTLSWPEADTVSFFPGLRQSVPWPDPFKYRDPRRVYFTGALPGERQTYRLDGQWQLAFTSDLNPPPTPPADAKFEPRQVPFRYWECRIDNRTPRPHGAYVRRTFTLPAEAGQRTYRLVISDVVDEASAFVNGQRVGNVRGGGTPLVADITQVAHPGTNEVVVLLRDLLAIMDPDYVNPQSPTPSALYLDAPGLMGAIGLQMGEVSLEVSPPIAVSDVLVMTSVQKKTLGTRLEVTNHGAQPVRARVKATVLDARKPVFELGEKEVSLQPGASTKVTFDKPWTNPRLWSPGDPHLYVLALETTDIATGKRLDLARERFGFRESWIRGNRLYFNGAPVRLKGTTTPWTVGADCDYQLARGCDIYDYLDEFGYLTTTPLGAVYNSSSKHNVEQDVFWEAARQNVLAAAKRIQNHPSIIAWDLSNEWLCFLDYSGGDPLLGAKRLRSLTEVLLQQDPTRWTFYNGDEDLHGLHDNFSFHYVLEATHPHPVSGFGMDGHSVYLPDGAYYRPLDRDFKEGERVVLNVYRNIGIKWNEKVIMDTENLWKVSNYMPPGLAKFVGEDDVLSPAVDSGAGPVAWMWKQNLDGHRDLGMSSVSVYGSIPAVTRRGYMLQTFIMPEMTHHGFSGQTITRRYSLHNDLMRPARLALRWRVLGPDGKPAVQGQDVRDMASGDLQRGVLSFKLPQVKQRTTCTLDLRLESTPPQSEIRNPKWTFAYGEQRDIEVWPDKPIRVLPSEVKNPLRQVFLFDPKGQTAEVLKKASVTFKPLTDLSIPESEPKGSVVIIGEGALDESNAGQVASLAKFVESGGRVLILAQSVTPGGLPVATKLEPREWSSQLFVRVPTHPVVSGITSWDLHFWAPDHVSARGAYSKPEGGAATPLVDSGTDIGLEWVQMMELYRGEGFYLLCQLPLASRYAEEPMARQLLARTLRHVAAGQAFRTPSRRLKAIVLPDSAIGKRLRDLNVACDLAASDAQLEAGSVVLVDARVSATEAQRAAWKKTLEQGATFVVCGARPTDAEWLSSLSGCPVRITVPPYRMWEGRGYRAASAATTAGLSHLDLYWKRHAEEEGATCQAEDPSLVIEPLQYFSVSANNARELVSPGALVELQIGKGRLLIDQRRWMTSNDQLTRTANRLISSLALGLNVNIAAATVSRELPRNITYKPVDLTPFANRALVDEVPDDGKGGWSDQGPTADLRTFPTGKPFFQGVPFTIGEAPRSCIVLASDLRQAADKMPTEVTIPIGHRVEGFYFLHASTYTGPGLAAQYQVQYADGTAAELPLYSEENIRDWISPPGPFPREKGTTSNVAWTGSCKMFSMIAVYRMLWVNPRPESPVKAVRFANPRRSACPILIGLTAVISKELPAQTPADVAKAMDLITQADKAVDAGQNQGAVDLLQQAVAAAPALSAAHQKLAEFYERLGDENAALEAYRAWADTGALTPLPWNRIGQILEKRKDYKGALDAYTRSLKIEWNQPPILEAKARVEKLAGK